MIPLLPSVRPRSLPFTSKKLSTGRPTQVYYETVTSCVNVWSVLRRLRLRDTLRAQMESLKAALPYIEITLSLLLIIGIVLQQRGANLGGAFGGDNFASTFYKRRGAEKFLFQATIVLAFLFVASAVAGFLL